MLKQLCKEPSNVTFPASTVRPSVVAVQQGRKVQHGIQHDWKGTYYGERKKDTSEAHDRL